MRRSTSASLSFDTLNLEGALFVPEVLDQAARGSFEGQGPGDYRLARGLKVNDEASRAFQIAQAAFKTFGDHPTKTVNLVVELFRDALGYSTLKPAAPVVIGDRTYPIGHWLTESVPLVIAPAGVGLDQAETAFAVAGSGYKKKSPFSLAQEFLNASEPCVWAVVTNGQQIRLLRDSPSLSRPAYLEFDLKTILDQDRYSDFGALWRLLHVSRAPGADAGWWEKWRLKGQETGERVRAGLSQAVKQSLRDLGTGFLKGRGPGNDELKRLLTEGQLTKDGYFRELLRLVYRFLFLITLEEQGLLHSAEENLTDEHRKARLRYSGGYSQARLKDRALRAATADEYGDQWEGLKVVFAGLGTGQPALDLPALGGLFAATECPHLEVAQLPNRSLLAALKRLRWAPGSTGALVPIDYQHRGPEEFGSVYESLLELVPVVDLAAGVFSFVGDVGDEGSDAGNARKTSGSYYTPDSLVQELIKSALDPVIEARTTDPKTDPVEALFSLKVIDPSCGSGHFLLAAARRLAERLAVLRSTDGSITAADYRHCLRQVVGRCLYGVDRNPMAVELARMALWLEGYEPGKPLGFLDHHLQVGDSLLGVMDLTVLWKGIPDDAFKALTGDDKDVCKALSAENKGAKKRLPKDPSKAQVNQLIDLKALETVKGLDEGDDDQVDQVESKRRAWNAAKSDLDASRMASAADLFLGAFMAPKADKEALKTTPTSAHLESFLSGGFLGMDVTASRLARAQELCREAEVFHWPLRFPQVFAQGGFDVVLGNPPWERIKLQEEEFFASRHPVIAQAANKSARGKLIEALPHGTSLDQALYRDFVTAKRTAEASSLYAHVKGDEGGRFPLTGVGDVNTYALFAETILDLTRAEGRSGFIVPLGIATDDSTKLFFGHVAKNGHLARLASFENEEFIFPGVHHAYKFSLVTVQGARSSEPAVLSFFARQAEQIHDERRKFVLAPAEFESLNPNTLTCPIFRSNKDAEITKGIYSRVPVLIREGDEAGNPWGIQFSAMFHMSNDSSIFRFEPLNNHLPLYEAKMIHPLDHRWATYAGASGSPAGDDEGGSRDVTEAEKSDPNFTVRPRYWVDQRQVLARLSPLPRDVTTAWLDRDQGKLKDLLGDPDLAAQIPAEVRAWRTASDVVKKIEGWLDRTCPKWLMGWRNICRATDERTVIASIIPRAPVGHSMPLLRTNRDAPNMAALLGNLGTLVFDYVARQKLGGTNLTFGYITQFCALPPSAYTPADLTFLVPRVLELTYTAHDLEPWAQDVWTSLDGESRLDLIHRHHESLIDEQRYVNPGVLIEPRAYEGPGREELETMDWSSALLPPFPWNPDRRAGLRAELDARYARLYGLTREELRYILDPASVMGDDYPSETFRVLKDREMKEYGEYRTGRLVLEAWDEEEHI